MNEIGCFIGGVGLKAVVDSGSRFNLVDKETWKFMKLQHVKVSSMKTNADKSFRSYGGGLLATLGTFGAEI